MGVNLFRNGQSSFFSRDLGDGPAQLTDKNVDFH